MFFRPEIAVLGLHGSQCHHGIFLQCGRHLLSAVENIHLSRQHIAFSRTLLHALPEFQFYSISLLFHPRRFINIEDQRSSRHIRQQLRHGHGIFIKISDISFQVRFALEFQQLFLQLAYLGGDPVGFLRPVGFPENFLLFGGFLLQSGDSLANLLLRQHELRRRVDRNTLQLLNGTLA